MNLPSFYSGVSSWPESEIDLASAAEKAAALTGAPFVALLLLPAGQGEVEQWRVGLKYAGKPAASQVGRAAVEEALKKRAQALAGSADQSYFKQIQWNKENGSALRLFGWEECAFLSFALVTGKDVASDPSVPAERERADYGWLILGTEKALTPKEELVFLAAARRLSELGLVRRLEESIRVRNQFLSIASHELKTPLTSIYGILQLQDRMTRMKADSSEVPVFGEAKKSYLKILLRQVERLNELIDGLLDVSRIQNGRFMVEPAEVDVCALLRDIIQGRLQVIANEAGVKVSLDAPETLNAWVDPVRMEEVVTNLVMNAIRFSPEGGVVWVRMKGDQEGFRLSVRDQGPSVSSSDRERIFKPFERAPRTTRLGGLGLGLYISRQIALLHGGNVSLVESVPGKGNVFEAYFPFRGSTVASA